MVVTGEFVETCRTARGAFTRAAELLLSGCNKPTRGWPQRAIGRVISDDDVQVIMKSINRRNRINVKKGLIPDSFLEAVKSKSKVIPQKIKNTPLPRYKGDVNSPGFLSSYEWRSVRMIVLKRDGARCACCGASAKTGAVINVDHIKPRRKHPHLAIDPNNLQVLCNDCNHGKGNWDSTDWR